MLKGRNTVIYGNVQFGKNVLLEDNVIIGHPSPAELAGCLDELENYESVEQLYNIRSQALVVIGNNAIIRSGSIIYSGVTIGDNFDCAHNVLIREDCHVGDYVYVKANTVMMPHCIVCTHCRLAGLLGDYSIVEDNVSTFGFLTHKYANHTIPGIKGDMRAPTLHKGCIVGRGAIIIGGIHIGQNALVAAGSIINFDVPPNAFVTGDLAAVRERNLMIQ